MADTEFRRKLLSLHINTGANKNTARTTPVIRDDGPGIAGTTTEHWDGRRDARVTGPTVIRNPNLKARTE